MADQKLGPAEVTEEEFAAAVFEDGGALVVDLSSIEEMKFDNMPKGVYDALIDEVSFGKSRNSGNNMFTFIFTIDNNPEYQGRKMYYYASFSPKALKGTKTALMRIDPVTFGGQFNPQEVVDSGNLLGKPVKLRIGIEKREDTGEDQNRIQAILPADTAASGAGDNSGGSFFNA